MDEWKKMKGKQREKIGRGRMKKEREKGKEAGGGSEVFKTMSANCRDNSEEEQQERRPSTGYITDQVFVFCICKNLKEMERVSGSQSMVSSEVEYKTRGMSKYAAAKA